MGLRRRVTRLEDRMSDISRNTFKPLEYTLPPGYAFYRTGPSLEEKLDALAEHLGLGWVSEKTEHGHYVKRDAE